MRRILQILQLQDINFGTEKHWWNHSRFNRLISWMKDKTTQKWLFVQGYIRLTSESNTRKTTSKKHFSVWHLKRFGHFWLQVVAAGGIQMDGNHKMTGVVWGTMY